MKLTRLVLLGVASVLVAGASMSDAIANQSTVQTVAQMQSMAIASGEFVAGEAPTTGTARIVTEGGHRYLELDTAFSTSNMGPDLHVLLDSTQTPPQSYDNLGGAINLGSLHDFSGAQRYPIPDAIDLANFDSVVIWCRMANATFGYAPLNPTNSASR
ncbi:MAG: DM13 domain-containing protein [Leptolyngbyaceae cyanobacterium SL_7_1]|nr:DM13 domain-containing protein [Leptolyngbyaceae cyanobacterium SL_7_1]